MVSHFQGSDMWPNLHRWKVQILWKSSVAPALLTLCMMHAQLLHLCLTLRPHGRQAPSFMWFSRQEYLSELPFSSSGINSLTVLYRFFCVAGNRITAGYILWWGFIFIVWILGKYGAQGTVLLLLGEVGCYSGFHCGHSSFPSACPLPTFLLLWLLTTSLRLPCGSVYK